MNRFYVFNAGCIRRGKDSIWLQKYLEKNGWVFVKTPKLANLIIISTCGVVHENEQKSLNAISAAKRKSAKDSIIVITGCLPNINPDSIRKIGNDFIFISTRDIFDFDKLINPKVKLSNIPQPDSVTEGTHIINYLIARSFCRKSRLYRSLFWKFYMNHMFINLSVHAIKKLQKINSIFKKEYNHKIEPYYNLSIARGCKSTCSFCATKLAIGGVRSVPVDQLVTEFKGCLKKGYKTIQLISEDTGCYGFDINTNISNLLKEFLEIDQEFKLVLIDFHPRWLIELQNDLVPLLVDNQHKIKELFIPIQSGSDNVLALMRRDHKIQDLIPILNKLYQQAPSIKIRTSILVGFPGETQNDFEQTVNFISKNNFEEVTINRYEDRPNTRSSKLKNKVEQHLIEKRALYLVEELGCSLLS